jgi:hypothetical protein
LNKWEDNGENSLWLLTPDELTKIPDGTVLECINGKKYTVGIDIIDDDTRFGYLAYGVRNPFNHEHKDIFLLMAIAK